MALRYTKTKEGVAANKAELVIRNIVRGKSLQSSGSLNIKGETRIKNCLKYNLGQGFRLVCIKESINLYVLFFGNHECSKRWIENNRTISADRISKTPDLFISIPVRQYMESKPAKANSPYDAESQDQFEEIPQSLLRKVFKGLAPAV